jgi:hypothetical protein
MAFFELRSDSYATPRRRIPGPRTIPASLRGAFRAVLLPRALVLDRLLLNCMTAHAGNCRCNRRRLPLMEPSWGKSVSPFRLPEAPGDGWILTIACRRIMCQDNLATCTNRPLKDGM